jgi:hypothetical protein
VAANNKATPNAIPTIPPVLKPNFSVLELAVVVGLAVAGLAVLGLAVLGLGLEQVLGLELKRATSAGTEPGTMWASWNWFMV